MRFGRLKGMRRVRPLLPALAALLTVCAFAVSAAGSSAPATPVIGSSPANPTNQTSAGFSFSDITPQASFRCSLDGSAYGSCSSPVSYPGPLAQGTHTFRVEALAGGKTSAAATRSWTIDTTAPTVKLSFPANSGLYDATSWGAGCAGGAGVCGTASDSSGVASVRVSVLQQSTGRYWNGASFSASSEVFGVAGGTASWRYPLALPAPDGSYTIHVRATDTLGNTTAAGSQLSATFVIDTQPPPAPQITQAPPSLTESTSASFSFSDAEAGATFLCALDGGSFAACNSPKAYKELSHAVHTFYVEARDAAGNLSGAATYSWTVSGRKSFTIAGGAAGSLAPGISQPLVLTISNPNSVAIYVVSLAVTVKPGSSNPGCDGPANLQITQSNASGSNALTVPAHGQVTLPAGSVSAPQALMRDLASNQDVCKGASFAFAYSGSAHS